VTKELSIQEVVSRLKDGMTVGVGGWGTRRKPMAIIEAVCASDLRDLTVVSYGGPDVGMLCRAGKVKKLIYGFVSLDVLPLDPFFRQARQSGAVEVMALDEGMLQWGLYAASLRLPFLPTRAGLGSSVMDHHPCLKRVRCPYSDEEFVAVPAIHLDVALCHANVVDRLGNAAILGDDPYFDDLFCGAAAQSFVSCERVVEVGELPLDKVVLRRDVVSGFVVAPKGAGFTLCPPDYDRDLVALGEYAGKSVPQGTASPSEGWEVLAVACAECFRGDGEILASPMGQIPRLGAWLARKTFAPDLLISDGECTLIADPEGDVAEARLTFRQIFDLVWSGRRHVLMGASQIDQFGNQNIACLGDYRRPKVQLLGPRGAPGNTVNHPTSYFVPRHSARVFVPEVDYISGVGNNRTDRGPYHELRRVVTNLCVMDFETPDGRMRLRSLHPGVTVAEVIENTGFALVVPDEVPQTRGPTEEERVILEELSA
jgi:glutaconate CoA-transferase subunit A